VPGYVSGAAAAWTVKFSETDRASSPAEVATTYRLRCVTEAK
jgi:hypothetical protein